MQLSLNVDRLAHLYNAKDSNLWHPFAWPARMLEAPQWAIKALVGDAAAETAALGPARKSLGQSMRQGAKAAAQSPLGLGLAVPVTAVLFGGAAPVAAALSLGLLAGNIGLSGPHQGAGSASWKSAAKNLLAYGTSGLVSEYAAAQVGRMGEALLDKGNAALPKRALGQFLATGGYTAALLTGAVLTVARCALLMGYWLLAAPVVATALGGGALYGAGSFCAERMWPRRFNEPKQAPVL